MVQVVPHCANLEADLIFHRKFHRSHVLLIDVRPHSVLPRSEIQWMGFPCVQELRNDANPCFDGPDLTMPNKSRFLYGYRPFV